MKPQRHASFGLLRSVPLGAGKAWLAAILALVLLGACGGRGSAPSLGPTSSEPVTVIVQRGDTVSAIARRHRVPPQQVIAANGLAHPYVIRPGQVLHVPGAALPEPALPPPVPVGYASSAAPSALGSPGVPDPAAPQLALPLIPGSIPGAPGRLVTAEALPPPPSAPAVEGPAVEAPAEPAFAALPLPPPSPPEMQASPAARSEAIPEARPRTRAAREPPPRRLPPGRFAWPVRGQVVSAFGSKGGGLVNDGVNIAAPRGTPVRAAADGTVIYAGNEVRGFGNLVLIQHAGGWVTAYGHADRILVRQGEAVRVGEEIARVGSTGAVSSPQLHFQVRQAGKPVDPAARLESSVAGR